MHVFQAEPIRTHLVFPDETVGKIFFFLLLTHFRYELNLSFLQSAFLTPQRKLPAAGENEANTRKRSRARLWPTSRDRLLSLWFPARPKAKVYADLPGRQVIKNPFCVFLTVIWVEFHILPSKVLSSLGDLSISVLLRVIFVCCKNPECMLKYVKPLAYS